MIETYFYNFQFQPNEHAIIWILLPVFVSLSFQLYDYWLKTVTVQWLGFDNYNFNHFTVDLIAHVCGLHQHTYKALVLSKKKIIIIIMIVMLV